MDAYLEVNGFAFNKPWCWIPDYSDLLAFIVKGSDRPMPRAASRSYNRYVNSHVLQFPVEVLGMVNDAGAAIADPRQGLIDHCDTIAASIGIADADGAVEAVFHEFDGGTRSASVHPSLPDFSTRGPGSGIYILELVVSGGRFEVGGS